MSMSGQLHLPNFAGFDNFSAEEFCPEFGSLKIHGEGFAVSVFIHKDKDGLLFLDQLRHTVDMAIKWARED